jgi:hypothetical protein
VEGFTVRVLEGGHFGGGEVHGLSVRILMVVVVVVVVVVVGVHLG